MPGTPVKKAAPETDHGAPQKPLSPIPPDEADLLLTLLNVPAHTLLLDTRSESIHQKSLVFIELCYIRGIIGM